MAPEVGIAPRAKRYHEVDIRTMNERILQVPELPANLHAVCG